MAELTSALNFNRTSRRRLMSYLSLYRQRKALANLDDHLLRDLGLTREEALREADRPLWDAPSHWR